MSETSSPVNPDVLSRLTARAALFQEAAAERLGLNPTDLRCLALAAAEPGMTASRLADLSGLTTGAITGVLDRLERAGLARREPDPADRRRTLVRPLPDRVAEIAAVYDPLERAIAAIAAAYDAGQRAAIGEFVERAVGIYEEQTARLRAAVRGGMVGEVFSAPLGDATIGRLAFTSGAPRLSLRAAPLGVAVEARVVAELAHSLLHLDAGAQVGELCRATFSGPVPDVHARHGEVSVHYKRRIDWRQRAARIGLSPEVPWMVDVSGGLSSLSADLRGLRLRSFEVRGGTDALDLRLPEPDGTSRVRLSGSAAVVTLRLPRGSAARLALSGGAQEVSFGDQRLRQVHGQLRLETQAAASVADRYEIELAGGVRDLKVALG